MEGGPDHAADDDGDVPPMTGGERTAIAYHEAGHAVVAVYLGLPVNRLSVLPNETTYGRMTHPSIAALDLDERNLRWERRIVARKMIVMTYAGVVAQKMVDPGVRPEHGALDEAAARDLSEEHGVFPRGISHVGDEEHLRNLERLRQEANRLVGRMPNPIGVLARALLAREDIPGAEVEAVVEPLVAPFRRRS